MYCISRWHEQIFIITLVFENLGENINKIFWDAYSLPVRKSTGFPCALGGQMTLVCEDNNGAKGSNPGRLR